MNSDEVHFRLLRSDDVPATNPDNLAFRFGLQDVRQVMIAGRRQPDGVLAFDFTLSAKPGKDPDHPAFAGRFASGPADDRFVYLSWWAIERGDYINRVKARLCKIGWDLVRFSREQGRPVTADMTGWKPGDARKYVEWYLSDR